MQTTRQPSKHARGMLVAKLAMVSILRSRLNPKRGRESMRTVTACRTVHCLDRSARPRTITIDPTEYRFKLALLRNNHEEMLQIIKTSNLIGQSIIGYLQQKGFPEVSVKSLRSIVNIHDMWIDCASFC